MIVGHLKYRSKVNNEDIVGDFAPSVAEADAILAKFEYAGVEAAAV